MVKGNTKSSATSGTRKKHLKKHAPSEEVPKEKKVKGKGKKNEPRVKMYIPPVKPAPVQPDPLETTGLAHTLPAALLVVLRNINKKAQVTKTRALEELQSAWVNQCLKEGRQSLITDTLVDMLPVWLHHVSALFVNPSRRVRVLAASVHAALLQIPPVRDQIIHLLRESLSESQLESILGTWCLAAYDVDRQVSTVAAKVWKDTISSQDSPTTLLFADNLQSLVITFIQRVALDPSGVYEYLNPLPPPPQPTRPPTNKRGPNKTAGGKVVAPLVQDEGDMARAKADEQEESETDRKARLRIGALGAVRWMTELNAALSPDLLEFCSNPALWTTLHPAEISPWLDIESFGWAQPNVRKAGWALVQTLVNSHKAQLESAVPIIGTAILRSAWIEVDTLVQGAMWQPLLLFLKQYPQCWTSDANRDQELEESDSEADSEHEQEIAKPATTHLKGPSQAYNEFLGFLQAGCSGSPIQGYPTVVIIVSTIPSSIFVSSTSDPSSPLDQFFDSFWQALDGRALSSLHRIAASAAFLSSLLECAVFLIKRMRNDGSRSSSNLGGLEGSLSIETACSALLRQQFSRIWEELTSGKLKVEERATARLLAQTLEGLLAVDSSLMETAWGVLVDALKTSVEKRENSGFVSAVLKVFYDRFRKEDNILKKHGQEFMDAVLQLAADQCETSLSAIQAMGGEPDSSGTGFTLMVSIMDRFRDGLFAANETFSNRLDSLFAQSAYRLLTLCTPLLLSYLLHRKNESKSLAVWHSLLSNIALGVEYGQVADLKAIETLLDAALKQQLPKFLVPQSAELDALVGGLLETGLHEPTSSQELALVRRILVCPDYFITPSASDTLWQVIIATFASNVNSLVQGEEANLFTIDSCVDLIRTTFSRGLNDIKFPESILPNVFLFSYLVPISTGSPDDEVEVTPSQATGRSLWEEWVASTSEDARFEVMNIIKIRLKTLMGDTTAEAMPEDILDLFPKKLPGVAPDLVQDILPSLHFLDETLDTLSPDAIDPTIAVLDPLIPPNADEVTKNKIRKAESTDRRGFSAYARSVATLLHAFIHDRQLARRNLWALRHLFALSVYAQDILDVPSAISRSPVFDSKVSVPALTHIIAQSKQVSVYLLTSSAAQDDENWRNVVLDRLLNETKYKNPQEGLSQLQMLLLTVLVKSRNGDGLRDARVLKIILDSLFYDQMSSDEAELWVQFARKIEKTAPQTAMTVISCITHSGAEPPKLDRYRNELAANLPGIKAAKANTEGLLTLRRLAASAPDSDSDVIFLQPTRAVNVIKGCQAWVLAEDDDEEIDEEVENAMLPIFMHLAPILQNVPGSHWAFIFDVLEATLDRVSPKVDEEVADTNDEATMIVGLARALRLLRVLDDLAKRNKALMSEWAERRMGILTIVRDLSILVDNDVEIASSTPRSTCRELVLSIIQHLPSSLIDDTTLPKMCHMVEDSSVSVQKMAYQLLKVAAQKRTEHFVIEAGVDTDAAIKASLPDELIAIIQRDIHINYDADDDDAYAHQDPTVFGYLLGWMLVFDAFQDASFKVKSGYIEQLRDSGLISDHFIPFVLGMLRIDQGSLAKVFKLDLWAVDKFYVRLYEPGSPHTIPILTAHVYYRALLTIPSLIHSWILDCKDRQLTNTVTTYTSTYFSPVLIRSELEHVRAHAAIDGLADDNMTVKVATAVNEVAAAYTVDEHQLEIKLRIPTDWPLHKIEVKDVKRVGVDENRWRAWVLGVQQTIWAHNGRIIDGLGLFKKNVTLHFEGQVECAICYSIISVMDGTLPKKPCKTCKNRFHAGCLYKWFNTSHSSSCPLCRSDII